MIAHLHSLHFSTIFYARMPIDVDMNLTHFVAINSFFLFSSSLLWPLHMQREFQHIMILRFFCLLQSNATCFCSSTTPRTRYDTEIYFYQNARAQATTREFGYVYETSVHANKQNKTEGECIRRTISGDSIHTTHIVSVPTLSRMEPKEWANETEWEKKVGERHAKK